jgi:hypothetical protein
MRQATMGHAQAASHTHLFTVRVWREDMGAGQAEWRGEVHEVITGERHYFRKLPTLIASLQALLRQHEPDGQQIGSRNEPEKRTGIEGRCRSCLPGGAQRVSVETWESPSASDDSSGVGVEDYAT